MCSVAFGESGGNLYSGGSDGNIYHFTNDTVTKKYQNNKGPVHTLAVRKDGDNEVLLVGGNDKTITAYSISKGALTKAWSIAVDSAPRSIDLY